MRKLRIHEVGGVKMKKKAICNSKKMYFLYCSFLGCSFGFALQRRFAELEKAFLQHFKSLKMEKN
jgi:hypothetical protein